MKRRTVEIDFYAALLGVTALVAFGYLRKRETEFYREMAHHWEHLHRSETQLRSTVNRLGM